MTIRPRFTSGLAMAAAALALAACSSTPPVHYHSLLAPPKPNAAGAAAAAQPAPFLVEVLAVGIPAELDQAQMVVHQADGSLAILDGERWAGPLADGIRTALSAEISQDLGTQDIAGLPRPAGKPLVRIKVQVRRMDAWPGQRVQMDADWSIGVADDSGNARLTCRGSFERPASGDYVQLVQAQQAAIAALGARIATDARAWAGSRTAGCSAGA
ncbi:membrane integrity-associated transporter subunit PqiC [Massilia sp. 9096]|uniref:PqiC family protein n=1 Tax=Massilia sp. 9096 TaxID=1500894 RepID=UPI000569A5BE|nr:PqiC family protein [Massilia sp. 9096]